MVYRVLKRCEFKGSSCDVPSHTEIRMGIHGVFGAKTLILKAVLVMSLQKLRYIALHVKFF